MISLIIFFNKLKALSLIVPMEHLNHRLTYKNGIKVINSSVNDATRVDDYFNFPDEFTFLTNNDESVCKTNTNGIQKCPKSLDSIVWKIDNVKRFVRFRNAEGGCLTLANHNRGYDTYEVIVKECDTKDNNQVFILSNDHGNFNADVNQFNAGKKTDDEKEKIKENDFKYSDN